MLVNPLAAVESAVRSARRRLVTQLLLNRLAVAWAVALAASLGWFLLEPLIFDSPPAWLRWAVLGTAVAITTAAAIGPGIGPCCYEVGEEVLRAFEHLGPGIAEGRMLDLAQVARRLLTKSGVGDVEASGLCTSCDEELFFSHRRDAGTTGRQAGMVRRWSS